MDVEPGWLTTQDVHELNLFTVTQAGEPFGILNEAALAGAIARPRNVFLYEPDRDILELACTLLIAIGRAHAFLQGNKRTALLSANLFLLRNGYRLRTHSPDGVSLDDLLGPITEDFIVRDRPAALLADLLADFIEDL